jgi:subtilase-type serine protease
VAPETGWRSVSGESLQPSNPRSRASWETPEYRRSNGLDLIDASEGYARNTGRPGGRGITVAVLDDGVDFGHPDLWPGSFDTQYSFAGAELPKDHGTPVAGVIAARRNGFGTHGVAYAANIVSIGTCKSSGGCFGDELDVTNADETAADIASAAGLTRSYGNINSTPEASSHIMNMSFTYLNVHNIPQITSAMRDAASAGRIMVAALGNCFERGPECFANGQLNQGIGPAGVPASNVADQGIAGWAIAVGSMNRSGTWRADHSNTCGSVRQYCLYAPGEDVHTTRDGGGYGQFYGTSFAAPHVAGAAAVLWAAFPNKRGNQIVRRLLTTAQPVPGDGNIASDGLSYTFGHGALDLGAAMNPVGFLSLSTQGGGSVPLADSYVALPPGFSAPPQSKALVHTVVYDEQMFPFLYDLAASFQGTERRAEGMLHEFLSSLGSSSAVSLDSADVGLQFVHDDERPELHWGAASGDDPDEELDVYRFDFAPTPGLTVAVG